MPFPIFEKYCLCSMSTCTEGSFSLCVYISAAAYTVVPAQFGGGAA